jgi:hypothetical protein
MMSRSYNFPPHLAADFAHVPKADLRRSAIRFGDHRINPVDAVAHHAFAQADRREGVRYVLLSNVGRHAVGSVVCASDLGPGADIGHLLAVEALRRVSEAELISMAQQLGPAEEGGGDVD